MHGLRSYILVLVFLCWKSKIWCMSARESGICGCSRILDAFCSHRSECCLLVLNQRIFSSNALCTTVWRRRPEHRSGLTQGHLFAPTQRQEMSPLHTTPKTGDVSALHTTSKTGDIKDRRYQRQEMSRVHVHGSPVSRPCARQSPRAMCTAVPL